MEPVLRQVFTEDTGLVVHRRGLMRSKAHPFMQVSLDGNVGDGGIFESKTTNWRLKDQWDDDQVSDHAEVQVQHGLAVTGRSHAHVVALIDGSNFQVRRVERDDRFISLLTEMEEEFVDPVRPGRHRTPGRRGGAAGGQDPAGPWSSATSRSPTRSWSPRSWLTSVRPRPPSRPRRSSRTCSRPRSVS